MNCWLMRPRRVLTFLWAALYSEFMVLSLSWVFDYVIFLRNCLVLMLTSWEIAKFPLSQFNWNHGCSAPKEIIDDVQVYCRNQMDKAEPGPPTRVSTHTPTMPERYIPTAACFQAADEEIQDDFLSWWRVVDGCPSTFASKEALLRWPKNQCRFNPFRFCLKSSTIISWQYTYRF